MPSINDLFIKSIGANAVGYRAHFKLPNGDIGITMPYTLQTLKDFVIPDCEKLGHKLLKIVEEKTDLIVRG